MKGQRLFVRAIEQGDHDAVRRFLITEGRAAAIPACGLLGKLVGDLVAVLAMQITADAVEIDEIVVARGLRRKRIGRVMLAELEQIAAKMERRRLIVREAAEESAAFLRRVGFEREGPTWIREVTASQQQV
ncbi:MAG TPA: GNAT family N-acetyltransferase [Thermoanaerobaculia bacterium]|nr:GNAT family N-acetyltransferase [Thermoanaerobaculia bacterium]